MSRYAVMVMVRMGLGTVVGLCTGCASPGRQEAPAPPTQVRAAAPESKALAPTPTRASSVEVPPTAASSTFTNRPARGPSSLEVKRFVVTTGVKDREPRSTTEPLVADGSAIFAFAELANPAGGSENVRITFERKGGAERVGNVTLPVPGQVSRHRTWAMTRFIRAPGVWDAVLWSENGQELVRTSFEVAAS
jgi:hypothetical protein